MRSIDRRGFLATVGLGSLGMAAAPPAAPERTASAGLQGMLISTVGEGLMYEHGLVHRLLSTYAECADRLEAGEEVPLGALLNAGALADEFVENYHEAFEEKFLYAPFGHAGRFTDLVAAMVKQHKVGRQLVKRTIFLAGKDVTSPDVRPKLISICRGYVRMYRAHAARETTDLLPALGLLGGTRLYAQMHAQMMTFRNERLGGIDLAGVRQKLVAIETTLGMADLNSFTAPLET